MSLIDSEEIKEQTRNLWRTCFHDSEDFMDIYFEEKYSDENNFTIRHDGQVISAMQMLPYALSVYKSVAHVGYVSGLATLPQYRRQGLAGRLLNESIRKLNAQGGIISFLVPADNKLREFYQRPANGAYWTTTFRTEMKFEIPADKDHEYPDFSLEEPDEWGEEIYVFYRRMQRNEPFTLRAAENDFFAAVRDCDAEGGHTLVVRHNGNICGLCIANPIADGRILVQDLVYSKEDALYTILRHLRDAYPEKELFTYMEVGGEAKGARAYAMARIVNVKRFFNLVINAFPGFQLHVGVGDDYAVPENNGYYKIGNGKCVVTDERPTTILTPGGLASLFLSAYPLQMRLLLDE